MDGVPQNAELGEDVVPIVIGFVCYCAHRYQRQGACNRVAHISCYASEAMEKSKAAKRGSGNLTLSDEVGCQQGRNQQLEDRSTPKMECLAEIAEEEMPTFVNWQVDIVQHGELPKVPG